MLNKPEEIRALTMLIIENLGQELDCSILQPAVISTGLVEMPDYFECIESLNKDNLIYILRVGGKERCGITNKGRSIISELPSLIPDGIREEALRCAWRYYDTLVNGIEYYTEIEELKDGAYLTTGVIVNKRKTCEVKTYFPTVREAYEAKNNCDKRPQTVINTVLAAVTGDVNFIM